MRRALAVALVLACVPAVAHADDKAQAIALFDAGLENMKAGNYADACKAFAASLAIVPDSGTRGSLARCYTKLGRVASAWRLWRELADTAPTPDLRADAKRQATRLEPRLPRYVVKAPASVRIEATLDGEAIDPTIDVPIPIDPGRHVVGATAEGHVAWRHELTAVEGETAEIVIPALAPLPVTEPVREPPPPPKHARRRFGPIIVGAGAAIAITGGVFGAIARGRFVDAEDACGGDIDRCDPRNLDAAQDQVDRARSAATVSTVMFAVGGAAIVAGIVLYVTAPKSEGRQVTLSPMLGGDSAGLAISGRY